MLSPPQECTLTHADKINTHVSWTSAAYEVVCREPLSQTGLGGYAVEIEYGVCGYGVHGVWCMHPRLTLCRCSEHKYVSTDRCNDMSLCHRHTALHEIQAFAPQLTHIHPNLHQLPGSNMLKAGHRCMSASASPLCCPAHCPNPIPTNAFVPGMSGPVAPSSAVPPYGSSVAL